MMEVKLCPHRKKKCVRDTHGDSEHEVEVVHEPKTPETDHGELNPIRSARRDRTVRHDSDATVSGDLSTESPSVASLDGGTSSDGSTPKKKKKKSKPTKKKDPKKKTLSYSESWS